MTWEAAGRAEASSRAVRLMWGGGDLSPASNSPPAPPLRMLRAPLGHLLRKTGAQGQGRPHPVHSQRRARREQAAQVMDLRPRHRCVNLALSDSIARACLPLHTASKTQANSLPAGASDGTAPGQAVTLSAWDRIQAGKLNPFSPAPNHRDLPAVGEGAGQGKRLPGDRREPRGRPPPALTWRDEGDVTRPRLGALSSRCSVPTATKLPDINCLLGPKALSPEGSMAFPFPSLGPTKQRLHGGGPCLAMTCLPVRGRHHKDQAGIVPHLTPSNTISGKC